MAEKNAPAAPPAEQPPVSGEGAGEAANMAAVADAVSAELSGNHDEDFASLERARRQRDPEAYKAEIRERADVVTVRVTEDGDGKISRGVHHAGVGDDHYEEGDTLQVERRTALELKKRHYVELPR